MMLDRGGAPKIHGIDRIVYPEIETERLENGIRMHSISIGSDPLVQITVCVRAGQAEQSVRLANTYTAKMLNKGTGAMGAQAVAEGFDFYGAWFGVYPGKHITQISLLCLRRHLGNVIDLFRDVIMSPSMPEEELKRLLEAGKSLYRENAEKVGWKANRELRRRLFGEVSAYCVDGECEDFDALTVEAVRRHHEMCYYAENMELVVSGMVDEEVKDVVRRSFGAIERSCRDAMRKCVPIRKASEEHRCVIRKEGVQSAVFMGVPLFGVEGEDVMGMKCLSLVLGGYFGSRLMRNIRETKGYTYGISSDAVFHKYDGFLCVSTQCDNKYAGAVIEEVYAEMDRLRSELGSEEEISIARNYALGEMLRGFEGFSPWSSALCSELAFSDGESYSFANVRRDEEGMRGLCAEVVRNMAVKYLNKDAFYEVVVGEPEM